MNNMLKQLVDKRFSVMVCGEFERGTSFLGLMHLLSMRSDFFNYDKKLQMKCLHEGIRNKSIYIDADISVTFK